MFNSKTESDGNWKRNPSKAWEMIREIWKARSDFISQMLIM